MITKYLLGPATDAFGYEAKDGGFIVGAGSWARRTTAPGFADSKPEYYEERRRLEAGKILIPDPARPDSLVLVADTEFRSASRTALSKAAAVFLGRSANGPKEWSASAPPTRKVVPDDYVELPDLIKRYVHPVYMKLLNRPLRGGVTVSGGVR